MKLLVASLRWLGRVQGESQALKRRLQAPLGFCDFVGDWKAHPVCNSGQKEMDTPPPLRITASAPLPRSKDGGYVVLPVLVPIVDPSPSLLPSLLWGGGP